MSDFSVLGTDPALTAQKGADGGGGYVLSPEDQAWLDDVYGKLTAKMKAEVGRVGAMIPYTTRDGKYHDLDVPGGLYYWTNGFWPGMLWQMYNATGDEDYRAPAEPVKYDSAAGLLELARHVGEYEKALYTKAALNILKACEARFCNWDPEQDSIVTGGTYFYHDPDGANTEVPIIYGDYYLIEAILKLKDKELFIW